VIRESLFFCDYLYFCDRTLAEFSGSVIYSASNLDAALPYCRASLALKCVRFIVY